jgi:hypothetical protein
MRGAIPPLPNMPSWRGAQSKHRDKFTFTSIAIYEEYKLRSFSLCNFLNPITFFSYMLQSWVLTPLAEQMFVRYTLR